MPNLFQSIVYLQIRRGWVSVRVITWSGGDFRWEGAARCFLGTDKKGRLAAISAEAAHLSSGLVGRLFTAFGHPRAFIDGFDETVAVINFAIRESGYKSKSKNLMFLVQLRDSWEGGLADVEHRALLEVCKRCGASQVRMLDQPFELAPPQLLEIARAKG